LELKVAFVLDAGCEIFFKEEVNDVLGGVPVGLKIRYC
jgi:hypothetical protein